MNEAFIIDGGVNYDILTWPMERQADRRVLARIMSYEYLWHNIREVGGAYGTGMLTRAQTEGLYTYRDPHLTESYETFAKAPEVLAGREYTEKDLTEARCPRWIRPKSPTLRPRSWTAGTSAASPMPCWPRTARPCAV